MGGLKGLTGPVYLDANIFIYALEGYSQFKSRVTTLFTAIDRHDIEAVTSELTLAEVLVKPFREQQVEQQAAYQRNITSYACISSGSDFSQYFSNSGPITRAFSH